MALPTPVPMNPSKDAKVRALAAEADALEPPKPDGWFVAHPTLVVLDRGAIIAATSYAISPPATPQLATLADRIMYGHGVWVQPAHRKHGLGRLLADARLEWAKRLGVRLFLGMTWAENTAMVRILEQQGCTLHSTIPGAYPHLGPDVEGLIYVKEIERWDG